MEDRYEIGKKIKLARQEKGLSQEQLANTMGYTKQTISNWERGISIPRYEDKRILSMTLGVAWDREEKTNMHYKEIIDFVTIDDVVSTVDAIIKHMNIDTPYKTSINKQLGRIMILLVAYYICIEEPKWYREYEEHKDISNFPYLPPAWDCVAEDIGSLLNLKQGEHIAGNKNTIVLANPIYEIISYWTSIVQIYLWDYQGEGEEQIMGYKHILADKGVDSGNKLLGILQKSEVENSFTTELRSALTDLQEFLLEI